MFFIFTVQISSMVQSCIVCRPIDLNFGGGIRDSLVLNMNGEDCIWSLGQSSFILRTVLTFPDFKRENRCFSLYYPDFIKGSISLCLSPNQPEI